ncbi:phage replication protein [Pseudomonas syringae]|uniref:phage replication protein n=1 Tax=Pseudomonas syringae TaxID=317 RepID=UPI001F36CA3E|nr:phage replication protein [Pseudomonas syringae]MCF5179611.1 phage replication protein [Pseudomonas syringae]MCF5312505.1 phage replication protein [Pseudomonas syringae]MCF5361118.1 phage replication protein [Pseudomonas syringae]MCF5392423.1 phage replication protein [Pseudomonas syringae]MCF5397115.1 phage replication protein [Pseudomonas syringae]
MARARNIKPALFKNEILGVADPMATLLFEGLWLLADKAGRLEDRPLRIKGELFPYRDGVDIEGLLQFLASEGFITRYTVGAKRYIQVENFDKHQNPHRNEPESVIPSVSEGCITTDFGGTTSAIIGSARADSLIPDSLNLIPDSLTTPTPAASSPPTDDLFPKFWKLYPNKKGKAAAEKAWKKIKVTDDLFTLIAQGLAKQCVSLAWTKDGGQFVPHPATWLNGKRWEDEVQPASNVHQFPQSRHTGFDTRDYKAGLTPRGDGTYDF